MLPRSPSAAPPRRYDVCIRGRGVVGQTLALLLARDRLRVALVGVDPHVQPPTAGTEARPDVRAYALNAASRALLQSARAWPMDTEASTPSITPITDMAVCGDDGGRLNFSAAAQQQDALGWIVDVPALEQRLADAVQFHSGIDCPPDIPNAHLTVVCEGKRSLTRDELGFVFETQPYAHHALAARLRCTLPHGGVARQWFHAGSVMALLPLGGAQGNLVALVWSVPSDQAQAWLAAEPDALAQAVAERAQQVLGDMAIDGAVQAWPLERSRAQRWAARTAIGSVVLAGDAAHAIHPLAGQGLNVGLADVAELAKVLHAREDWRALGDMRLLRRYERARQADARAMAWLTDGLFGLFNQTDGRAQTLRNWGMTGVDRLGPLKHWLARQAMGRTARTDTAG